MTPQSESGVADKLMRQAWPLFAGWLLATTRLNKEFVRWRKNEVPRKSVTSCAY